MRDTDDEAIELEDPEAGYEDLDDSDVLPEPEGAEPSEPDEGEADAAEPSEQEAGTDFNALAAQHRILRRNYDVLSSRFNQLLDAIHPPKGSGEDDQEPEVPDPDEDLAGSLVGRLDRLERLTQKDREERIQAQERDAIKTEIQAAQQQVLAYREAHPEYVPAIQHLVATTLEEAREEFPGATDREIQQVLERETIRRLLQWSRAGLNPGEQLMKLAQRRGYVPKPSSESHDDPRRQVQAQKRRARSSSTIASVPGASSAKRFSVKDAVTMSEEDWAAKLSDVPLRDLLRGKQRA